MLDQIPTEGTNHSNARTDGVSRRSRVLRGDEDPGALPGPRSVLALFQGSSELLGGGIKRLNGTPDGMRSSSQEMAGRPMIALS